MVSYRRLSVLRLWLLLAVVLFGMSAPAGVMPVRRIVQGDVANEYLVGLKDVPRDQVDAIANEIAGKVGGDLVAVWKDAVHGFWIRVPDSDAGLLLVDRRVSSVEQNSRVYPSSVQETIANGACSGEGCGRWGSDALWQKPKETPAEGFDPIANPLWHLARISHRSRTEANYERYMYTNGGSGVIAYVVDGGVLRFHREFATTDSLTPDEQRDPARYERILEVAGSNVIATRGGPDQLPSSAPRVRCEQPPSFMERIPFVNNPAPGPLFWSDWPWYNPFSEASLAIDSGGISDHGTGVASVLGGRTVGVAKMVSIVPVKANGCGNTSTIADMAAALNWILAEEKARTTRRLAVVSMSMYGKYNVGGGEVTLFEQAVDSVTKYGIPVFAAADNYRTDACNITPARMSRRGGRGLVITVGGLAKGSDTQWTNGEESGSNIGPCVDIVAPAEEMSVATSTSWAEYRHTANRENARYSGTSYAAPMVAGIAARMMSEDSQLAGTLTTGPSDANVAFTKMIGDRIVASATLVADTSALGENSPNRIAYMGSIGLTQHPVSQNLVQPVSGDPVLRTCLNAIGLSEPCLSVSVPASAPVCRYQWFRSMSPDYNTPNEIDCAGTGCAVALPAGHTGTFSLPDVKVTMPTSTNRRYYYWARVFSSCNGAIEEYSDSAIAAVTLGCAVITTQPESVWVGYQGAAAPELRMVAQADAGATVVWYDGVRGDLAKSTALGAGESPNELGEGVWEYTYQPPPFDPSNFDSSRYWARITAACGFIDSDVAMVQRCPTPTISALTQGVTDISTRTVTISGDGSNARSYCLMILKTLDADQNVESNWTDYRCSATPSFHVNDGVENWVKVRAENECYSVSTPAFKVTPPLPSALCTYNTSHAPTASPNPISAGQPVFIAQNFLQHDYSWLARPYGSTGPGDPLPDVVNQIVVQPSQSMVYWSRLNVCNTVKDSAKLLLLVRPRIDTQPKDATTSSAHVAHLSVGATALPEATSYAYEWFEVTDHDNPQSRATQQVLNTNVPGSYFVRVTATYGNTGAGELPFDSAFQGNRSVSVDSRVANVTCGFPPKPVKRRATRSAQAPSTEARTGTISSQSTEVVETITPGQVVTISVEKEAGVTYEWYESDDYNDRSRQIGAGDTVVVAPLIKTTYWVLATALCDTTPVHKESDFFVVDVVSCDVTILTQPDSATVVAPTGSTASTSASVKAFSSRTLHYRWYDAVSATAIANSDSSTHQWSGVSPQYQDVYVEAFVYKLNADGTESATPECVVRSRTVRLAVIPTEPQRFFFRDTGATVYSPSLPQKLQVVMDPPASADHVYTYAWYRDNGTPEGEHLSWATTSELLVTTSSIDTFWVKVTGEHKYRLNDIVIPYQDVTVSPRMYVSLYGTCAMPPLKVTQNLVQIPANTSLPVTFVAICDWHDVTFEWFGGQTGDTRDPVSSDVGKPNQLTVATGSIHPYWVRARRECGTVQDSPTLTFRREPCGPVLIDQELQSVDVAYGGTTSLSVSPLFEGDPSYTWYQNEGQGTPVVGQDYSPTLRRENVTTSGRYWVTVRNLDCSNGADSYMGTIRVASHPLIAPPDWLTEVWTDSGTSILLTGTSGGASSYQWYRGEVGDDRTPIGGATLGTYLTPNLTAATKYWVRVRESGGGIVDSPTMTVKICERPRVTGTSLTTLNLEQGQAAYLDAPATGTNISYQWYQGGNGAGDYVNATPVGRPIDRLLIQASSNTTYWLAVSGRCAPDATGASIGLSPVFHVSVCPDIDGDELPTTTRTQVTSGETTTLTIDVDGAEVIEWYKVVGTSAAVKFAEGSPLTTATVTSPAITEVTSFYAIARNGTCSRESRSITIPLCTTPTIHWSGGNPKQITKGQQFFLVTGLAAGETANFQWYIGATSGNVANSTLVYQSSNAYQMVLQTTTSFWVRAWNEVTGCYSDTSVHTVNVCVPTIVTQPLSQTINAGTTATLSVGTDLSGMQYQWYRGAVGDTSNPLTGHTVVDKISTISVTPAADTTYWVRVTGCTGTGLNPATRDSLAAVITVCQIPTITAQPTNRWMTTSNTTLSVTATGTELTYQWYKGLSGDITQPQPSTTANLTVSPSQTTNYWVRVSGRCGTPLNSTTAKVSIKPNINGQPAGGPITKGTSRALTVIANGAELTYQWYQRPPTGSAILIAGAVSASYTPPPVMADATYYVRVYSGIAYDTSVDATLTVCLPREIGVIGYPSGVSGSQVVLQVQDAAAGETFEWYRGPAGNTSDPIGNGTLQYLYPQVTTLYWVRTKRTGCDADSAVKTINICYPKINTEPEATSLIASGTTKTLNVNVTGTAPLVYQWYRGVRGDTSAPVGTNSNAFTTPVLTTSTTYWVRISTSATACATKWIDSQSATINVCQPPVITAQPQPIIIQKNISYTISVTATGDNLHYQWYIGDSGVTTTPVGTDSNQLSVTSGTTKKYWVRITGSCGVLDSVAALQSVKPVITSHPQEADVCGLGGMATFSVSATGADAYSWYRYSSGLQEIVGTTRILTIAVPNASATFRAVATSGAASATSVTVGVVILPVPTVTSFTATQETSTRWRLRAYIAPDDQGLVQFRFYQGPLGDTSILLADTSNYSYPVYPDPRPKTYWVRVYYIDTGCATDRAVTIN